VKIGIVNEPLPAAVLRAALAEIGHQVVWIAGTMEHVQSCCAAIVPDLVFVDVHLRAVDGLDVVRHVGRDRRVPVLVTTTSCADPARVFEALGQGAMDVVTLPAVAVTEQGGSVAPEVTRLLLTKLTTIGRLVDGGVPAVPRDAEAVCSQLVAVGASAGGPAALAVLLTALPRTFPAGLVVVQHLGEGFTDGVAEWLQRGTALEVRVAREGDRPQVGLVLVAGGEQHLVFKSASRVGYTPEPRDKVYRPSIDVFFDSVRCAWRGSTIGVLLTGMGRDGAAGLKALRADGHHTIAQDEATSAVYGMPKAAAALGAAVEVLPIERIAGKLMEWTASGARERAPVRQKR
jgi:chemotaxis response regulator CheB